MECNIQYNYDRESTQFSIRFVDDKSEQLLPWTQFKWDIYEILKKIGKDRIEQRRLQDEILKKYRKGSN